LQESDEVPVHGSPIDAVVPTNTTAVPFVSGSFTNNHTDTGDEVPFRLQQAPPSDPVRTMMCKLQGKGHEHYLDLIHDKMALEDAIIRSTSISLDDGIDQRLDELNCHEYLFILQPFTKNLTHSLA
jgi:hypothetical protein